MNIRRVVKVLLAIPVAYFTTAAVAIATAMVTAERKYRKRGL